LLKKNEAHQCHNASIAAFDTWLITLQSTLFVVEKYALYWPRRYRTYCIFFSHLQ